MTTSSTKVLEGQDAVIPFKCSSKSKVVNSIDRINIPPKTLEESQYTFDYSTQTLTIKKDAISSKERKINISVVIVDKVHSVSVSCTSLDVTSSIEEVENQGNFETTLEIEKAHRQTHQFIDVVIKIGQEILPRADYE